MSEKIYSVYVISKIEDGFAVSPCKIGFSADVQKRLKSLRTSCPFPVDVVAHVRVPSLEDARVFEKTIHQLMQSNNTHGEWFDVCPLNAAWVIAQMMKTKLRASLPDDPQLLARALKSFNVQSILDRTFDLVMARNARDARLASVS